MGQDRTRKNKVVQGRTSEGKVEHGLARRGEVDLRQDKAKQGRTR